MTLTEDMTRYIEATFRAEDRLAAQRLLAAAVIEDGSPAGARLLRCALVGAEGSLRSLEYLVGLLRVDWRDVVMAGEYAWREGRPVRVRNLGLPIAEDAPRAPAGPAPAAPCTCTVPARRTP